LIAKLISYSKPSEFTTYDSRKAMPRDCQDLVAFCARVSNPSNQNNSKTSEKLLKYLAKHKHWSPFEMVSACIEINTTRDIARQILRHRSFSFQEFSQRYADASFLAESIDTPHLRTQDPKNRQNSIDNLNEYKDTIYKSQMRELFSKSKALYDMMIKDGVAKECARFVLPLATPTRMYMNGTIRSWIHYINLRTANGTQKEHMDVANQCKDIFIKQLPVVSEALGWNVR
jgi:thymidylate synthase (FAD)